MSNIQYLWFDSKDEEERQKEFRRMYYRQIEEDNLDRIKKEFERNLELEFKEALGADRYGREPNRKGYRGGYRYRDLHMWCGRIKKIRVPKGEKGYKYKLLEPYSRRDERMTEAIYRAYVYGMSDRKVSKYFKELYREEVISAQGVSDIYKRLTKNVDKWHKRKIQDEYRYIYLDGMVQGIKEAVRKQKTVLVAYGIKATGKKEVIDYAIEMGESAAAWSRFLQDLYDRGLVGANLELVIHDGCPGLIEALSWVWPKVKRQICSVHRLRNLNKRLKDSNARKMMMKQASKIYRSRSRREAISRAQAFKRRWSVCEPKAVMLFIKGIEETFTYFDFDEKSWSLLKSTNPIERYLEEWRRRLRTMRCLNNVDSCNRILFGQVIEYNVQQEGFPNYSKSELILT